VTTRQGATVAVVFLLAVVLAFTVGRCSGGATAAERAQADTIRAQQHTLRVQAAHLDTVAAALLAARAETVRVQVAKILPARLHTDTVITNSVTLVPDSAALHTALNVERVACDNAIAALAADSLALHNVWVATRSQRDDALRLQLRTQGALEAALRVRKPSRILLGATVGYGGVLSGGRVVTGPSASAGLTIKIPLPRIL
jgi:hypothetical protein